MPKKGIHPLVHRMTVVLRNGATVQMGTTMKWKSPQVLQTVGG